MGNPSRLTRWKDRASMAIWWKVICRFNVITSKTPGFSTSTHRCRKRFLKFVWKHERHQIPKAILRGKLCWTLILTLNYYRATVILRVPYVILSQKQMHWLKEAEWLWVLFHVQKLDMEGGSGYEIRVEKKERTDHELRGWRGEANEMHVTWKQKGSYGAGSKRGSWDGERGGEGDKYKQSLYENAQMKPIASHANLKKTNKKVNRIENTCILLFCTWVNAW